MTEPKEQPPMTPASRAAMQAMLRIVATLQRDMARSPRRGSLFLAEMVVEARLVSDHLDGKRSNVKRLTSEVVPQLVSMRTALKVLHGLAAEGLTFTETDPKDGRASITVPTAKLLERARRGAGNAWARAAT